MKRIATRSVDIASCGMNCTLCIGYRRERNRCGGCNGDNNGKPAHCAACRIKTCPERGKYRFCFSCGKYPCRRMRQLDKRYATRYGMSMLENLSSIKNDGIRVFVRNENRRWRCPVCGDLICVHRTACLNCTTERDN